MATKKANGSERYVMLTTEHRGDVVDDADGRVSALGEIVGSRIGRSFPDGIEDIDLADSIEQIAVLIRPIRSIIAKATER